MSAGDVAHLGEREALARLELLANVSRILDTTLEEFDPAMTEVAEACIEDFADLCAIEVIGTDGEVLTVAYRHSPNGNLDPPRAWTALGRATAPDRRAVLVYGDGEDESETLIQARDRLGAQSMMVVPMAGGGLTLGWLVLAIGSNRRGFRPSALSVGSELASRLSSSVQRAMLMREMQSAVREQTRSVRRLRRLATAATNLAGAATPQAVLEVACVEACVIHDAAGAVARWTRSDGRVVAAHSGDVDHRLVDQVFDASDPGRSTRGEGWVLFPLPSTDPWEQASLVVFVGDDFANEEELVLSSLVSLIPVAFERAAMTETAVVHESRLRAVVEGSPVALVGLDPYGKVTLANRTAQELFGWTTYPVGLPVEGDSGGVLEDLAGAVLEAGAVVNRTATIGSRDVSLSGAPLPPARAEEPGSVLIAGTDLSDIRRAERALVQAQRLEAMGQVAGRVAHDFNNILTLIVGYAGLLRNGVDDPSQQLLVDQIDEATRRAAVLTQQMLGMSRRRRNDGETNSDLGRSLDQLRDVLDRLAGAGIELTISGPDRAVLVPLDASDMEQILVNLVINACDALAGTGHVAISVDTSSASDLATVILRVIDDGPGMHPDVLARCLEPFFTTKARGQGSGLGLSTVYGLVGEAGGTMEVDSGAGFGTRISILLPLLPLLPVLTLAPVPGPEVLVPRGSRASATYPDGPVLVVEDDPDLLLFAETTLADAGFETLTALSAEAALEILAQETTVALLVTDIGLPGIRGTELVEQARVLRPCLPVLYATGYEPPQADAEGRDPSDPVLVKPYTPEGLCRSVADLLGS